MATNDQETQDTPKSSSKTVVVGCKLPNGLHMDVGKDNERVRVTLNGANHSRIIGGYGLTEVDSDFWDAWFKDHQKFPPVMNGEIFVQSTHKRAESHAQDHAELESGFEPINPQKPGAGVETYKADDK